jgi:hypothetical protein
MANSGAPVQRLIEQMAEAVTRPIFFSAIAAPYVTYGVPRFCAADGLGRSPHLPVDGR